MAHIGNVTLDVVENEKPLRSVKTTDHPVEGGQNIVDHIEKQPMRLDIIGVITGPDAAVRIKRLEYYMDAGIPVEYSCRSTVADVIIETFNEDKNSTNIGGTTFNISLKKIRISDGGEVSKLKLPDVAKAQAGKTGSKGLQQTQTPAQMAAANGNHVKGYKG